MRIHLLIGGLLVLAATPVAAQEAPESCRRWSRRPVWVVNCWNGGDCRATRPRPRHRARS